MDGVFMRGFLRFSFAVILLVGLFVFGSVIAEIVYLCEPIDTDNTEAVSVNSALTDPDSACFAEKERYEIRLWIIDILGKIECIFNNCVK